VFAAASAICDDEWDGVSGSVLGRLDFSGHADYIHVLGSDTVPEV
jgi:hypothetical protein